MGNKSKKGFTLVEIIVVVALIGIVGVAVISIMTPAGNMFAKMQRQAQAKMIASGVMQVIEPQVRFGTNLQLVSSANYSDNTNRYLFTNSGVFYKVEDGVKTDLFGSDFYQGYQVALKCGTPAASTVSLQITVTMTGDPSVSSTLTTTIQNLNSSSISDNGDVLRFEWRTTPPSQTS